MPRFVARIAERDSGIGFGRCKSGGYMREALLGAVFLVAATIIGSFLKPNEDQTRPLVPTTGSAPDDHHH